MKTVFIDGAHGVAGERLDALLATSSLPYKYHHLSSEYARDKERRYQAIREADIAVLCLPDDIARETMQDLMDVDTVIIDASTAHRTVDGWTYGYPELHPDQQARIRTSRRISNPGCFANGMLAIVAPLLSIYPDMPITLAGASGYSAGGKKAIQRQHESPIGFRITNGLSEHVHLQEVRHWLGIEQPLAFVPSVGAFEAGQMVWTTIFQQGCTIPLDEILEHYKTHYQYAPDIHVHALEKSSLIPEQCAGSLGLSIYGHAEGSYMHLYAMYDNLGRGSAGSLLRLLTLLSE